MGLQIMKTDFFEDTQDYVCSISSTEFEVFCIPVSHSDGPTAEESDDDPISYIEKHWPKHCVKCFDPDSDKAINIYPTMTQN